MSKPNETQDTFSEKLKDMQKAYNKRMERSSDRGELLRREIQAYELIFDIDKLPLNPEIYNSYRPIKHLGFSITQGEINRIREAYSRYIVNGLKPEGDFVKGKDGQFSRSEPSSVTLHYYELATDYFNYLQWLKAKKPEKKEQKLTLKQIAFFYIYEGRIIDSESKDGIAREYGFTAKTSGLKLDRFYKQYIKRSERIGLEAGTDNSTGNKRMKNKISNIERIIPLLSEKAQKQAIDEIKTIKSNISNQL